MEARNCPRCKRLFNYVSSPVCPACEKAEEESFQIMKAYIDENPNCTMAELSDATEVSVKRINQYIREGRLEISKGMSGDITCDQCGKPIKTGRFCDACAVKINRNLTEMISATPADARESNQRMHTLGKKKSL